VQPPAVQAVPALPASVVHPPHEFSGRQAFPTQQPFEQEVASHTQAPPVVQSSPVPHAMHAAPAVPQVALLAAWHRPVASQQPVAHDVPSHTHEPVALQRCPCAQAPQVLPAVPHSPSDSL
jgi:hypothetical protein